MRVSGFTFVRNAVRLDYPIVESIKSVLPIVDEFVVNVGASDDGTIELIREIQSQKIQIVESHWNPKVTTGGYVLAQQTNIALFNCTGTWAIYLQSDELIHERDHEWLLDVMTEYENDDRIEGLLLRRLTFFGDYKTISVAPRFRRDLACRVVKPHRFVLSRGDAAGFTVHPKYKEKGRGLRVVDTGLDFSHYSNIRDPQHSAAFIREKGRFWKMPTENIDVDSGHYYNSVPRKFVTAYEGTHPAPIAERVAHHSVFLDHDSVAWRRALTWRERLSLISVTLEQIFAPLLGIKRDRIVASYRGRQGISWLPW